jgi:hypothetical protein
MARRLFRPRPLPYPEPQDRDEPGPRQGLKTRIQLVVHLDDAIRGMQQDRDETVVAMNRSVHLTLRALDLHA